MKRDFGAFALIVTIFAIYGACLFFVGWITLEVFGWIPALIMLALMVIPIFIPGNGSSCSGGSNCDYGGSDE